MDTAIARVDELTVRKVGAARSRDGCSRLLVQLAWAEWADAQRSFRRKPDGGNSMRMASNRAEAKGQILTFNQSRA